MCAVDENAVLILQPVIYLLQGDPQNIQVHPSRQDPIHIQNTHVQYVYTLRDPTPIISLSLSARAAQAAHADPNPIVPQQAGISGSMHVAKPKGSPGRAVYTGEIPCLELYVLRIYFVQFSGSGKLHAIIGGHIWQSLP